MELKQARAASMNQAAPAFETFFQMNMEAPQRLAGAPGQVAVFSGRAPHKDSANEDAASVLRMGASGAVLMVADGVGGLPAGEDASRLVIETIAGQLQALPVESRDNLRETILDGLDLANARIMAETSGGATTLALVEIQGRQIRTYHAGDSIVLVVGQRGKIKLQTVPHSPVGYAVESGMLDEDEALQHEDRHLVSNIVGVADMRVEVGGTLTLDERDTLIVASDGLADNLTVQEIVDIMRKGRLEQSLAQLVQACRERMTRPVPDQPSHSDDLTVIAYRP
jgi:serine/threonine protein phosphatase PrpC